MSSGVDTSLSKKLANDGASQDASALNKTLGFFQCWPAESRCVSFFDDNKALGEAYMPHKSEGQGYLTNINPNGLLNMMMEFDFRIFKP